MIISMGHYILKAFLFLFALSFVSLLCLSSALFVLKNEATPEEKIEMFLVEDLNRLHNAKFLPEALENLAEIEVYGGTHRAKSWLDGLRLPFSKSSEGSHNLEVLFVDWIEGSKEGVMVQFNLVEKASGNMVWELGRTYILRDHTTFYYQLRTHLMNWLRH